MSTSEVVRSAGLRAHWHAVANVDSLVGSPVGVRLLGDDYVLWRGPDGNVVAAPDSCPHRQSPLSAGTIESGCLRCPYHGWLFGAEGVCQEVPSAAAGAPVPPRAHLETVYAAEKYGLVWICPGEPAAPIPEVGEEDDSDFRRINTEVQVWKVAAPRMVDNFLDIAHFPFVHVGTFGGAQNPRVSPVELEDLEGGFFGYRYEIVAENPDEARATSGSREPVVERAMSSGFRLPLTVRSTIAYRSGLRHILLLLSTPMDAESSYFTFVVWRNDDFDVPAEEVIAFDRAIGEEDRVMLERLDGEMPLDRTVLVSVQADKASVEWRRQFAELVRA